MTRKELLQIPGLGALIQSLNENSAPAGSLILPRPHCTARFAEPGDVWRVVDDTQQTEDHDYSPTNPHCSTVVILKREDELAGEHAVYRVAPVLADIRYCGVEDAIFPRGVFGYEAAVACGCEFTLTSKELDCCEGALPEKWFDQLADFAAWMESKDGEVESAFPPLLKTGRPFTHTDDPGYIFHANLAANLQPLMATVLETVWADEREPAGEPTFAELVSIGLKSFFAQFPILRVAGGTDTPTASSEYIISTLFGNAKLTLFVQRAGNNVKTVFKVSLPEAHWPLHILWQRRTVRGELIGSEVTLTFSQNEQKIEHPLVLESDDETWTFAYRHDPPPTP